MRIVQALRPVAAQRITVRSFVSSIAASTDQNPPKDSLLDRKKINTESREYSKSQSDDAAAEDSPAYDRNTDPDSQMQQMGAQSTHTNPLESSPANQDLSKPQDKGDSEMSGSSSIKTEKRPGGRQSGRGDA